MSSHSHPEYLTAAALTGYATEQWVEDKGYAVKSLVDIALNAKLDKSLFDKLFTVVYKSDGVTIDYIKTA